ncbi:MAG: hypothetical protein ACMXX7_01345 [Candidatus Woesearchaeota archaeon]
MLALILIVSGCSTYKEETIGVSDLLLSDEYVYNLDLYPSSPCEVEIYETSNRSSLSEFGSCFFKGSNESLEVVIQIRKFSNFDDLFGTYQYQSSHLRNIEGLISEDKFGDFSKFYINVEEDYMGHLNEEGVYIYHLWVVKDDFLIHITTKDYFDDKYLVENIANNILSKI